MQHHLSAQKIHFPQHQHQLALLDLTAIAKSPFLLLLSSRGRRRRHFAEERKDLKKKKKSCTRTYGIAGHFACAVCYLPISQPFLPWSAENSNVGCWGRRASRKIVFLLLRPFPPDSLEPCRDFSLKLAQRQQNVRCQISSRIPAKTVPFSRRSLVPDNFPSTLALKSSWTGRNSPCVL